MFFDSPNFSYKKHIFRFLGYNCFCISVTHSQMSSPPPPSICPRTTRTCCHLNTKKKKGAKKHPLEESKEKQNHTAHDSNSIRHRTDVVKKTALRNRSFLSLLYSNGFFFIYRLQVRVLITSWERSLRTTCLREVTFLPHSIAPLARTPSST